MFQDPGFRDLFRVLPVFLRVVGSVEDPESPTRPQLIFAAEVRDGQTMWGRTEMTPDGQLRWKWVRLHIYCQYQLLTIFPDLRGGWAGSLEVPYSLHFDCTPKG
jgi:hypothetical protein